jgi:hypothetical protein
MFSSKDLFFTPATTGYRISNSLRFRSAASAYLNRTFGTPTLGTKLTYSAWVKRGALGANAVVFSIGQSTGIANYLQCFFDTSNQLHVYGVTSSSAVMDVYTTAVFRDPSAWYHVVVTIDTTDATGANRVKLYVNGVQQAVTTTTTITQNATIPGNVSGYIGGIGAVIYNAAYTNYLDGYLAEVNFIDGQALTPSSFGETDATTGVWKPKAYTGGSYGTNGFYLKFADNSGATATTIGKDSSGNGNNWTPTNISVTAGVTYDSMIDTPTPYDDGGNGVGNYCVLNPLASLGGGTISSANLNFAVPAVDDKACLSTIAVNNTTSKWYCEVTLLSPAGTSDYQVGLFSSSTASYSTTPMAAMFNTTIQVNGAQAATGTPSLASGDIVGIAYDGSAGAVSFYKNNALVGTYTISGANNRPLYFGARSNSGGVVTQYAFNFGQRPFAYTPPSGFKALNTQNLPTPTIAAGNKYMDVLTWTGDNSSIGTTKNRTGLGFQPDFVWVKNRSNAYWHNLYDAVRTAGSSKNLSSNTTNAEGDSASIYGYISAFNSDGFTTTNGSDATSPGIWVNQNTQTFVAWNWKANGAGTVNNVGTIQSTVSANTTAGFSVVIYTGTLTGAPGTCPTVGHGLGVAPSLVISKSRNVTGVDSGAWFVWSANTGSTDNYLRLNTTAAVASVTGGGGGPMVAPTSTVFSTPYISGANINANNYVAYCFAAVAGYSAFGSYTGNGSADGPFVFTGFRPKFVLVKRTDSTSNWFIHDTARDTYNVSSANLYAELSNAEDTGPAGNMDFLSNGFKSRTGGGSNPNVSGATYIYAAFCENPLKYALAR